MDRIKEKINEYIEKENTQYAIMIDGEWGSGKTFFIKNEYIKKEEKNDICFAIWS